jgi:hypothetical protein
METIIIVSIEKVKTPIKQRHSQQMTIDKWKLKLL